MKNQLLKTTAVACAMGIMLFSCKKDDETTVTPVTTTTPTIDKDLIVDDFSIEALFETSQAISDEGATDGTNLKKARKYTCAVRTYTIDSVNKTATFTYTFDGTTVCTADGKIRGGSFTVMINSWKLKNKGTKAVFTFNDYKVTNGTGETFEVNGIRTVENLDDINTTNGIHQQVIVTGLGGTGTQAAVKKKDGSIVKWESNKTRKQTAGANTPSDITDDVFELTGSQGGVSAKGTTYNIDIKTPLVGKLCDSIPQPVSGTMDLKFSTTTYAVNFGNGACDGEFTLTATVLVAGVPTTLPAITLDIPKK